MGYQLDVNHLADRTELELKALCGKKYSGKNAGSNGGLPFPYDAREKIKEAPPSMDWRLFGAVTPVKGKQNTNFFKTSNISIGFFSLSDQSVCGSCWSFGTTGAVEGAYFLKYGKLKRLSQQVGADR